MLIVEDNAILRYLLGEIIRGHFPEVLVREAENGANLLKLITEHPPDLVLMDIRLGAGKNGLQLTADIKAAYPEIIVAMMTVCDEPEYREMAVRVGAEFFLSKSDYHNGKIASLVSTVIERRRCA